MEGAEATERLFAEVVALRLVTQRLVAHVGGLYGDMNGFMRSEHEMALSDLQRMNINDDNPARGKRIRDRAESVIDQIYSVMRAGEPPKS